MKVLIAPAAAMTVALCLGAAGVGAAQTPDDPLPEGPGKAVVVRACTGCHDASQIVYKRRAPEDWQEVIGKMVDNGAELTGDEQDAVYAYLVKNYGPKPAADAAPGPSL